MEKLGKRCCCKREGGAGCRDDARDMIGRTDLPPSLHQPNPKTSKFRGEASRQSKNNGTGPLALSRDGPTSCPRQNAAGFHATHSFSPSCKPSHATSLLYTTPHVLCRCTGTRNNTYDNAAAAKSRRHARLSAPSLALVREHVRNLRAHV